MDPLFPVPSNGLVIDLPVEEEKNKGYNKCFIAKNEFFDSFKNFIIVWYKQNYFPSVNNVSNIKERKWIKEKPNWRHFSTNEILSASTTTLL